MTPLLRVNVGCGQTPTPGWVNLDNSPSVRLARSGIARAVLAKLGLIRAGQRDFIEFARSRDILWADATKSLPLPTGSAEVVYSSHMVEHLDRRALASFLAEARRVLVRGGTLRLAVPDLRKMVDRYVASGDADELIERTMLVRPTGRTARDRALHLLVGDRHHQWMYDGPSLCRTLAEHGFADCRVLQPGETTIAEPGGLNLREREEESAYVEARKA